MGASKNPHDDISEVLLDEETIAAELLAVQGRRADIGGYYAPDPVRTTAVMRPSSTFNAALAQLG